MTDKDDMTAAPRQPTDPARELAEVVRSYHPGDDWCPNLRDALARYDAWAQSAPAPDALTLTDEDCAAIAAAWINVGTADDLAGDLQAAAERSYRAGFAAGAARARPAPAAEDDALVARLRAIDYTAPHDDLCHEAADRIAALTAERDEPMGWDKFGKVIIEIGNAVRKQLPYHPDPGVRAARKSNSPAEILVDIDMLGRYLKEAEGRATKAEAALAERDKECDALRKAIGNALYSMSGYAPPEFNSASGILMNAIGKLDAAIRESKPTAPAQSPER